MKKRAISLLVTVILVLGLAVPALAYDLPDNSLLEASSASTGTATVTDWNGESHTVYRYPAGTVFTPKSGMTNFQYVYNLSTGESQYLNQRFTLPETGAYELTAFDQGIWTTTAYVMAEGAPIPEPVEPEPEPEPEPVPEVTWYETPDNGWIYSDAASTGSVTVTDSEGTVQTVYQYPVGTAFSIQSGQMVGGGATVFLTGLYDIVTGEKLAYSLYDWTLPASGYYKLEAYDSWGGPNTYAYVTAGAAPVDPEPAGDQPSNWAREQVAEAVEAGLVPEALQSKYQTAITRAEFCALAVELYEGEKGEITERASFTDSTDENVEKMAGLGVVNGVGDGLFEPDRNLTREEAATILSRLAEAMDCALTDGTPDFADAEEISSWAAGAVARMQNAGVMNGIEDNRFAPEDPYTREQSILTVLRLFHLV